MPKTPLPDGYTPTPRVRTKAANASQPFDLAKWMEQTLGGSADESALDASAPDASIAITVATRLERILCTMIALHIGRAPSKKVMDDVFKYPSALSSFDAKIKLCNLTGMLTDDMVADLNIIRDIRNLFCHSANQVAFTDAKIVYLCNRLNYHGLPKEIRETIYRQYAEEISISKRQFLCANTMLYLMLMYFIYRKAASFEAIVRNADEINASARDIMH